MTNTYAEHWVIAWNSDRTYHDFVRCHPDRSQDEAEAFLGDERGLSTTVEVNVFANFAAAQTAAGKRIDELEKLKKQSIAESARRIVAQA